MTTQDRITSLEIELRNLEGELAFRFMALAVISVPVVVFLGISIVSLALT